MSREDKSINTWLGWLLSLALFIVYSLPQAVSGDELNDLLSGQPTESASAGKVIETESSVQDDRKIRKRLEEIFAELEMLKGVEISVNKGIVSLSGEVGTGGLEDKAVQLAAQVEGVVEVKNALSINRSVRTRLETTLNKLWKLSQQVLAGLPVFLLALSVVILFWWLGSILRGSRIFRRAAPNPFIGNLFAQVVHLILIVLGFILALVLLDATSLIGTIMGAAGIVGLAVGFAVRDTVENYIASILLSLRNPFVANDYVMINGHDGNVLKLTSRATVLISPDGNHIRIPNAVVFKAVITNYTRHPERRFQFDVKVDSQKDLLLAQSLALNTLKATDGVLADPKPLVVIEELGEADVLLRLYGWINQKDTSFSKVRSEAIRAVKSAFDRASILISEPLDGLADPVAGSSDSAVDARKPPAAKNEPPVPAASSAKITVPPLTAQQEIRDLSPDHTLEKRVEAERTQDDGQDLLSEKAPQE